MYHLNVSRLQTSLFHAFQMFSATIYNLLRIRSVFLRLHHPEDSAVERSSPTHVTKTTRYRDPPHLPVEVMANGTPFHLDVYNNVGSQYNYTT